MIQTTKSLAKSNFTRLFASNLTDNYLKTVQIEISRKAAKTQRNREKKDCLFSFLLGDFAAWRELIDSIADHSTGFNYFSAAFAFVIAVSDEVGSFSMNMCMVVSDIVRFSSAVRFDKTHFTVTASAR